MPKQGWVLIAGILAIWTTSAQAEAPAVTATAPAVFGPASSATSGQAEIEPPEDLRVLRLTDVQWRILNRVFQRHVFESPPKAVDRGPLSITAEPTVPGALYRLGSGGDLPVRLSLAVLAAGPPSRVGLRYYVEDFYGRKVADGAVEPVFTDETGTARRVITLKELTAFGCYHVLVTASTEDHLAVASVDLAVVFPPGGQVDSKGAFGVTVPAGNLPDDMVEICRRLGAVHLATEIKDPPGLGVLLTTLVPSGTSTGFENIGSGGPDSSHSKESLNRWCLGGPVIPPEARGDALAKTIEDYRLWLTHQITAMRKAGMGPTVAATPETLADILSEGPVLQGADGITLSLYASSQAPNLRSGAYAQSLAYAAGEARQMGVSRVIVGATGEDPTAWSPQQQAWKLVTRHVLSLAGGAERVFVTDGQGLPAPSAAAYAWMTRVLGGLNYQGTVWSDVPLLESHLFAAPDHPTVAVVWSWVGADPAQPDCGALVFDDGSRLEAYDCVGAPVGIWKGTRLIVPLGEAPIYIISRERGAGQVRDRLRSAHVLGLTAASVWVRSLAADEKGDHMTARLWLQSHRPEGIDGVAGLVPPPGWTVRQTKQSFGLGGGQSKELIFDLDRATPDKDAPSAAPATAQPPYELSIAISLSEASIRRTQLVWPTQIHQRTIEVGYGLDDWAGLSPVVVTSESGQVRAEVRTAWDADNFYFSAIVYRQRESFRTGRFASDGDAVQLAWAADDGAARPEASGGSTDLAAVTFADGKPQVIRLGGPRIFKRDHLPGNLDPWYGPIDGAKADIAYDQKQKATIFEAAIPLKALKSVHVERGRAIRFAFRIGDGAGVPLDWSRAAAVPDFLAGPGNFMPASCVDALPCLGLWTFIGPTPEAKPSPEPDKKADEK
jgi:hypothetical protein